MLVSFILEGKKEYMGSICQHTLVKNQCEINIREWGISPLMPISFSYSLPLYSLIPNRIKFQFPLPHVFLLLHPF